MVANEPPNKLRSRGAEERGEPLSAIRQGSQYGSEANQDPACRSQKEHPFLELQSFFCLLQREFRISPARDRKVARFFLFDDSDRHRIGCAAPNFYTIK